MNKIPRLILLASVFSMSLLLNGCGAKGAADSVALTEPNAPAMSGTTATDGFLWINFRRQQAGLPTLLRNTKLDNAAQSHSDYQKLNNIISHDEVSSNVGFTGATLGDRLTAAGYTFTPDLSQAMGEIISRTSNDLGDNAVEDLLGAIYHRFVMLEPVYVEAGAGAATTDSGDTYFTVDFAANGFGPGLGTGKFATYPFNGQGNVRLSVNSDEEEPDPVPSARIVGYPISIHANLGTTIVIQSFTVRPRDANDDLEVQLLDKQTDANVGYESYAAIIPLSPLSATTTYDVHFVGTVDAVAVDSTWSFTTADE